jgi:hypothetical protein
MCTSCTELLTDMTMKLQNWDSHYGINRVGFIQIVQDLLEALIEEMTATESVFSNLMMYRQHFVKEIQCRILCRSDKRFHHW